MYYCQFPGCDYSCVDKSQINFHHIIPRSMGGSNKKSNLLTLCPTCHTKIYVPNMKYGTHSIQNDNAIIINRKMLSTGGICYEYKYCNDNETKYSLIRE
jgi:hypothetical protein